MCLKIKVNMLKTGLGNIKSDTQEALAKAI